MATLSKSNSQLADKNQKALIGTRQSAVTAAVVAHALNSTFSDTEVEAALNLLGTRINDLITVLEAHGLVESNDP